jgi:hypothetical protein
LKLGSYSKTEHDELVEEVEGWKIYDIRKTHPENALEAAGRFAVLNS